MIQSALQRAYFCRIQKGQSNSVALEEPICFNCARQSIFEESGFVTEERVRQSRWSNNLDSAAWVFPQHFQGDLI